MPDSYILTGPAGTSVDLATWTIYEEGIDTGAAEIRVPGIVENPLAEGGMLAFEQARAREWTFPLRLASIGTYGGLDGLAVHLQNQARPGGQLTVIPQGMGSDNRIVFDVLHGELRMRRYMPRVQEQAARRAYDLVLRTQPFGYSPTWIVLASAASVGLPGKLDLSASLIGDAPGLAVVVVSPTQAGPPTAVGTWMIDTVAWSLGGRPSFHPLLGGGSWVSAIPSGAYNARSESITGTALTLYTSPTQTGWTAVAYYTIPSGLEPAYRGVHRAYAYLRRHTDIVPVGPSNMMKVALDVAPALLPSAPFASVTMKATFNGGPASAAVYPMLDLGLLSIPAAASGAQGAQTLRLWAYGPGQAGTNNNFTEIAGVALLPVTPAGILSKGLVAPDFQVGSAGVAKFDGQRRTVEISLAASVASGIAVADGLGNYRGGFPQIGASHVAVALAAAARRGAHATAYLFEVNADQPLVHYPLADTPSTPTMLDVSGNARHGTYIKGGSYGIPGRGYGDPNELAHYFDGASAAAQCASNVALNIASPAGTGLMTFELWFRRLRLTPSYDEIMFGQGTNITAGTYSGFAIGFAGPSQAQVGRGQLTLFGYPSAVWSPYGQQIASVANLADYGWHHLVVRQTRNSQSNHYTVFVDGSKIEQSVAAFLSATYAGTGQIVLGRQPAAATKFFGGELADFAVYAGSLPDERVQAHYLAGIGKDTRAVRPGPQRAAVTVLYRPRFTFSRNL